jgi:hypothetical protein
MDRICVAAVNTSARVVSKCQSLGPDVIAPKKAVTVHGKFAAGNNEHTAISLAITPDHGCIPQSTYPRPGAVLPLTILPCQESQVDKCRTRRVFHGSLCRNFHAVQRLCRLRTVVDGCTTAAQTSMLPLYAMWRLV